VVLRVARVVRVVRVACVVRVVALFVMLRVAAWCCVVLCCADEIVSAAVM
jgi:hypothetical protein